MLEVKAKDQGHKRMCSQKKVFRKNFQAISKKKGLQKKILGNLQKKTSSKKIFRRSTNF